jgi:hypothetical protein
MAASTRTSQWRPNSHDDDGTIDLQPRASGKPKHIVDTTTTENRRGKKRIDKIGKREEGPENEENN